MKKKMTFTTIVLSVAIVALGVYIYNEYVTPLYIDNGRQTTSVDIAFKSSVELNKNTNQHDIFAIEIEILGESTSNLTILLENTEGQAIKEIKLKKGEIDFIYQNDWYTDKCNLTFSSKEKMNGQLKINYRFLGLN